MILHQKKIQRRTGFSDESTMISYIIIVCGGSMDNITKTCNKFTWLKEWVLCYEYMYGHSKN